MGVIGSYIRISIVSRQRLGFNSGGNGEIVQLVEQLVRCNTKPICRWFDSISPPTTPTTMGVNIMCRLKPLTFGLRKMVSVRGACTTLPKILGRITRSNSGNYLTHGVTYTNAVVAQLDKSALLIRGHVLEIRVSIQPI